jgi:hypothetical protein
VKRCRAFISAHRPLESTRLASDALQFELSDKARARAWQDKDQDQDYQDADGERDMDISMESRYETQLSLMGGEWDMIEEQKLELVSNGSSSNDQGEAQVTKSSAQETSTQRGQSTIITPQEVLLDSTPFSLAAVDAGIGHSRVNTAGSQSLSASATTFSFSLDSESFPQPGSPSDGIRDEGEWPRATIRP